MSKHFVRLAYEGFKIALAGSIEPHSGRCFACHHLPKLGNDRATPPPPSASNRWRSKLWVYDTVSTSLFGLRKSRAWCVWRIDKTDDRVFRWLADKGLGVRDGAMFVRILEYVTKQQPGSMPARRFIKKWQHHYFRKAADQLANHSIENGKLVDEQAGCNRCHTINGKGAKYGPDLTDIAKRFQGSKLLKQCVKPSAEINKEYQTQQVLLDDGRLLTGVVVEETDEQIRLVPNLLKPDKFVTIHKDSIEQRRATEVSSMPAGLLDTFTAEEIFDLVAFLQSRGSINQ